ncbi:hypothetical protein FACS189491_07590 [Spirochaetia bacterium]|nr:hypothetical protein FACS189491_07590 [Spirochaetia bacterium]
MPRDLSRTRKPDTDLLVESEEHIIIRQYSSPIPPASELQSLQTIDPAFPERVMRIVEKHAEADIRRKDRFSISPIIGQIATFLICCMGFGIGVPQTKVCLI